MSKTVIVSPIFYMGNKKKLIAKGLIDLFPQNIHTFFDLCAGSAIVSMNTKANRYVINDINQHLQSLYRLFIYRGSQEIIDKINERINLYGLARERTKRNQYHDIDKLKQYKESYFALRNHYNNTPDGFDEKIFDFYTLMFYSFSQQFRFNIKGEFNMPVGNDCFSQKNEEYIKNGCDFFSSNNVHISHFDFRKLPISKLHQNDFVYIDPPYLNTTAIYNENNGWSSDDELSLYKFCESLNQASIKWGLSNVFENKGKTNDRLVQWCEQNNWNVFAFNKFTYMACGKGNSQAKEVFICNY